MLLSAGCGADALNGARSTALHLAVQRGFLEVVRILCERGCDVNLPVSVGPQVPLTLTNPGLRRQLDSRDSHLSVTTGPYWQDAHANTPLHSAISAGAGANGIVEVLTEVPGINVAAADSQGFTLLHHASLKGHAL